MCWIKVRIVARDAPKFTVEHADDLGRLVVYDPPCLGVPQRRHRNFLRVIWVASGVGLVQVAEAVDGIRCAFGELRVAREQPNLLANDWESAGDGDRGFELLDCA